MTDQLKELIERLEKAAEPGRALDKLILKSITLGDDGDYIVGLPPHQFTVQTAPRFTASIDAALTLVPKGSQWTIEADAAWVRVLTKDDVAEFQGHLFQREGKCTAIALLIAIFKARVHLRDASEQKAVSPEGADGPQRDMEASRG
jgi:hypothetical protein